MVKSLRKPQQGLVALRPDRFQDLSNRGGYVRVASAGLGQFGLLNPAVFQNPDHIFFL